MFDYEALGNQMARKGHPMFFFFFDDNIEDNIIIYNTDDGQEYSPYPKVYCNMPWLPLVFISFTLSPSSWVNWSLSSLEETNEKGMAILC